MLSREENELFTRVGAGTLAGEFLRRYWHPVALAEEFKQKQTKRLRMLGENLVLYKGQDGEYGLVQENCPHRGASLFYGKVEGNNVRCAYHVWMFNPQGQCGEQAAEPPESSFKDRVRFSAYPVQKIAGLLFAYMGPKPAPLLPNYDVMARKDGVRKIRLHPVLDCNWLQPM